ncbi:MAG: hypothetical protein V4683_16720, partial [Bacteroidota bacterium]
MKILFSIVFFCTTTFISYSQNNSLNVFLNCQIAKCYNDYLRTELSHFNFVRDQASADVIIMVTSINNASGGRNFQLFFNGVNKYSSQSDTLNVSVKQDATDDIIRKNLLNAISLGLLKYMDDSNIAETVRVSFSKSTTKAKTPKPDKWKNWIFGLGGNGRLTGESNRKNIAIDGNFRGGKTTEKSKFSFYSYYAQRTNSVTVDSVMSTVKVNDYGFNSLFVKSFTNHWSIGGFVKGFHSVYQNILFSKSIA